MKKGNIALIVLVLILGLALGMSQMNKEPDSIILSTTTSTQDSGLLDHILPTFTEATGIEVKVVAVGTGQALQMGRDGEADVLLVHAKNDELIFVEEGHGLERFDVMYNDFVLVGNAPVEGATIQEVLQAIMDQNLTFVSRGDDSGTHKKELSIWKALGADPNGDWYLSAGKGMGDVLQMTNEVEGYTLTDRATYLAMKDALDLDIVFEGDEVMLNLYGVIAVNPSKNDQINAGGASAFINWILSSETQEMIGNYGKDQYGQALFFPNAE